MALRHGRFAKLQIHSAGEKNWLISSEQFVCHESELERDATAFCCLLESTDKQIGKKGKKETGRMRKRDGKIFSKFNESQEERFDVEKFFDVQILVRVSIQELGTKVCLFGCFRSPTFILSSLSSIDRSCQTKR